MNGLAEFHLQLQIFLLFAHRRQIDLPILEPTTAVPRAPNGFGTP